jgi:hypothetical protein
MGMFRTVYSMTDLNLLYWRRFQRLARRTTIVAGSARVESQPERKSAVSKNPEPQPSTAPSIVQPMIDELKGTTQPPKADEVAPPRGPLHPPEPAELDQDPGGGYNPDGTYPQT